jgi:hypothetical protein
MLGVGEMNNYKATFSTDPCIIELRDRVAKLEAQAGNLKGSLTSSTPPPVAKVTRDRDETGNYVIVHDTATPPPEPPTDEELSDLWTIYDGIVDLRDFVVIARAVLERWGE